eukprot:765203-Hanusia_phi.AAC.3
MTPGAPSRSSTCRMPMKGERVPQEEVTGDNAVGGAELGAAQDEEEREPQVVGEVHAVRALQIPDVMHKKRHVVDVRAAVA